MPTGPKGEKRPADVIGNAVKIARIATGEEEDVLAPTPEGVSEKKAYAARRRAEVMTPERRSEIARAAALAKRKAPSDDEL